MKSSEDSAARTAKIEKERRDTRTKPETPVAGVGESEPSVGAAPEALFSNFSNQLSLQERAAIVQFFDGASARELLLESAPVVAVPDLYVPEILNGFPHSFQNLSQDGVINLLAVFAAFIRRAGANGTAASGSDLSVEVRQALAVNARGQRVMRKTLLVDGVTCANEERIL